MVSLLADRLPQAMLILREGFIRRILQEMFRRLLHKGVRLSGRLPLEARLHRHLPRGFRLLRHLHPEARQSSRLPGQTPQEARLFSRLQPDRVEQQL